MENLNERLLTAWLTLSTVVNNERIVPTIPFNEAHVCNLLYNQRKLEPEVYLTATDLCIRTRMLKSQMNKVLASLEKREMIERFPAPEDRRKAYVRLREDNLDKFEEVNAAVIRLVDCVIRELGEETAEKTVEIFTRIANCVDDSIADLGEDGLGHNR